MSLGFSATTVSGANFTAATTVTLACVAFAPTSPYRFTYVDEVDGSIQVGWSGQLLSRSAPPS